MLRPRLLACLLAAALAVPSAASAQGAGDDQYQDPLGDTPAQGGGGGGGGLSEAPPGAAGGGGGSGGRGGASGSGSGSASDPGTDSGTTDRAPAPGAAAGQEATLPNTGSDPRVLAYVAVVFLLAGTGLRLRTLDPDDF